MANIARWLEMHFNQLLFNMLAPLLDIIFMTMDQGYMVHVGDLAIHGKSACLMMQLEDISYGQSTITNTYMGANAGLSPGDYPY
jgi:hypothetical protein